VDTAWGPDGMLPWDVAAVIARQGDRFRPTPRIEWALARL